MEELTSNRLVSEQPEINAEADLLDSLSNAIDPDADFADVPYAQYMDVHSSYSDDYIYGMHSESMEMDMVQNCEKHRRKDVSGKGWKVGQTDTKIRAL